MVARKFDYNHSGIYYYDVVLFHDDELCVTSQKKEIEAALIKTLIQKNKKFNIFPSNQLKEELFLYQYEHGIRPIQLRTNSSKNDQIFFTFEFLRGDNPMRVIEQTEYIERF